MCRSADVRLLDRDKIKIRAFSVKLTLTKNQFQLLPDSLTLVYLPRTVTGSGLEIDGSKIRPDSRAFVTLHRVVSIGGEGKVVEYVSKERVRAGEGVRYEVYLGDVKLLNGGFGRGDGDEEGWGMGCRCLLEEELLGLDLVTAEVCVAAEGRVAVCEKVEMVVRRRRREVIRLEDIPETNEEEEEEECGCCCCGGEEEEEEEEESGGDGEMMTSEDEAEMEGVGWALDIGLWVMCLGVGLLVSKASSRSLRRKKFFKKFL